MNYKSILLLFLIWSYSFADSYGQVSKQVTVSGRVFIPENSKKEKLKLYLKSKKDVQIEHKNGNFTCTISQPDTLTVYLPGYKKKQIPVSLDSIRFITVKLDKDAPDFNEVIVSTGYQQISRQRATGSFVVMDSALLNRSTGANILERLDGVTSGLIFNKNVYAGAQNNQSNISIRTRSTIFANAEPLIIVDNFPYNGDISTINPNDVENITILKDAAAASIWGAYSGNGVIVITTKKGKYNRPPSISFNGNVGFSRKPNLYYTPILNSQNFIQVEKYLFDQGYYDYTLSTKYQSILPAVELLNSMKNGQITASQLEDSLLVLGHYDIRKDLQKYFYRGSASQQYALSVSGGSNNQQYYLSGGYDKSLFSLKGNKNDRVTLNAQNTFRIFKQRLELKMGIVFTHANTTNNNYGLSSSYPYEQIADQQGNALSVPIYYRQSYTDTAGSGNLLDWQYRPLDELHNADNTSQLTDYRINVSGSYKILTGLSISVLYQYNKGISKQQDIYSQNTFYTRNLINELSQVNLSSSNIIRPIPLGSIVDFSNKQYWSHNLRGVIDYHTTWNLKHHVSFLGGMEIRSAKNASQGYRLYGYDDATLTHSNMDFYNTFPVYYNDWGTEMIWDGISNYSSTAHFLSYFSNASYSFKQKYTFTGSIRKDESNIFGVKSNQKGVPLWSTGLAWNINKEGFYNLEELPYLRLRTTYGYNGNVDNTLSSLVTISPYTNNVYGSKTMYIVNPPNDQLRWEKTRTINFGIDFATIQNRIQGSIEYYLKNGKDLIGYSPMDPTSGMSSFKGNVADMRGKGIDINLESHNLNGIFLWNTNFLFSYVNDKVSHYLMPTGSISNFFTNSISPMQGYPLYSVFALSWAGLNKEGNPRVWLDGNITEGTDIGYTSVLNSTNLKNLHYIGRATPAIFGSFRNSFTYRRYALSFNVTYKFGYYFQRPSINYANLFTGNYFSPNEIFEHRWQNPGDELKTDIPAMIYPANANRDFIYQRSDAVIAKGDHIRLQDIRLDYQLNTVSSFIKNTQLYIYASNIAILWRANKYGIDPDVIPAASGYTYPNPFMLTVGVKIDF
ncbi:SusC/RagA family TonB-linked outer membrane protein [Rhizosphaericola mali]|uniref:SusC/RagA family TonB-linked outer membrane protein n=1 Tax=Rhizosphaericola mali TaxID=2545455 RepID=A0A5P2FZT3_9BACT|nr:SusC/RagA family TonB-linked outer membrane protein [Rhizosphaericola mali]QES87369.1 SusC/RagA family TonB-linked outer membrane protein [Rhizosphaericola mali]